jgi:pimeloyl-ACP methyl ester carboxylesterase
MKRSGRDSDVAILARVAALEAVAYARAGLLLGRNRRIPRAARAGRLGVLFVHGVAADSSEFGPLVETLAGQADGFEAYEYRTGRPIAELIEGLLRHVRELCRRYERVMVVGHSLGGLLLRAVLQHEAAPVGVVALATICAPLNGTAVSRFAPTAVLRGLTPDSPLIRHLSRTAHRLKPLEPAILTVGARLDQFVVPFDSAFLEGGRRLLLDDCGHVSSLFDRRVHRAIRDLLWLSASSRAHLR